MADTVLFEFLHTEMVAELWAHDPDPGPGVSAGSRGEEVGATTVTPRGERRACQTSGFEPRPSPGLAGQHLALASSSGKWGSRRCRLGVIAKLSEMTQGKALSSRPE